MPKLILVILLYSLITISGGTAYALDSPQNTQLTPQPETPAQPEIPKQVSTVILDNNRLSVEFVDVSFGDILQAIGKKAGFTVEGFSSVLNKKVTTRFNDLDIDVGLVRLFSLVKENNYLINYDSKGSISRLKIYNIITADENNKAGGLRGAGSFSPAPTGAVTPGTVPFRSWRSRRFRPPPETPAQ